MGRRVEGEQGRILKRNVCLGCVQGWRWMGEGFKVDGRAGGAARGGRREKSAYKRGRDRRQSAYLRPNVNVYE